MLKNFLLILLLWVPSAGVLFAQPVPAGLVAEFDAICQEKFPADGPGGAVLVAKGDQILYHKAFGLDDVGQKTPLQTGMQFRIGSVTKQFTAVAILQLVEAGRLSIQDEITRFIPDYPTHGKKITVGHLLNHTSGIKSYTDMEEWTPEVMKQDFTPAGLIDFFKDQPMDFDPGTAYRYNNSGYVLLGYIIEKVSGMSYADYLDKQVFEKAGLKNTLYEKQKRPVENWAIGYQREDSGYTEAPPLSMTQPYAAGSLLSTVEDLYRWTKAVNAGKVVSPALLKKAYTPTILPDGTNTRYGYGWMTGNVLGHRTIEHGGGINGFLSMLIYLPDDDICVAILTNCDCNPPGETAAELAALAAGETLALEEIDIDVRKLEEYTGVFENDQQQKRVIKIENGSLISQRIGGLTTRLSPVGKDAFRLSAAMAEIRFLRDAGTGAVTGLEMDSRRDLGERWVKTTEAMPEGPEEVTLTADQLEPYVGEYSLAPGFSITVTRNGTRLFGQGTGQPQFEMFAKSEHRFFLKVVQAEIEFFPDADGTINKMTLFQNGMELPGARVK